jgi:hypothetical protein
MWLSLVIVSEYPTKMFLVNKTHSYSMTNLGENNVDDPPHVNEIRECSETVEINRLALIRLLMMGERVSMKNGSDSTAESIAYESLGCDEIAPSVEDVYSPKN